MERENEIRDLTNELNMTSKELEDAKLLLYHNSKEKDQMHEDIQALTKENQHINAELIKLSQAKDTLREMNEDLLNRDKMTSQQVRASQIEKEDFLYNYKKVCLDNERIMENMKSLSNENKEMFSKIQLLEQEIYGLQLKLNTAQQNEKKYISQIQQLERQISHTAMQLESAHNQLQQAQITKEDLLSDMQTAKNVIYKLKSK